MAQYKFEGALDNISEQQLQFIHKVLVEHGYENSKVTFEPVGKAGDNYVANVKRIIVEGENGKFQMVAKLGSNIETLRQMTLTPILFGNEHTIYTEVLPTFVQLQKDAGVPEVEQLRYAKCYGSQIEQPHEVILLEDLKVSQFEMLDRFKSLTNDCVRSVLKNLAILHSLSHVLKHQNPEKYISFQEKLIDDYQLRTENEMMKMFFVGIENDTLSILEDPAHINSFKNKITEALNIGLKFSKTERNCKYNVIQHGDPWTNNFMFKVKDGEVSESIVLDYQQAKSKNPVTDIMGLIFNCTDYETRKQNFYDWIDYYHSEFDKSLANFKLKANYIYPRDKLDADMKRYGKLMFGLAVLMAGMMSRRAEEAEKMMDGFLNTEMVEDKMKEYAEEVSIKSSDAEVKTTYKNKVIGLINSFNEFGLL